jgi:hypothetical protein
MAAAREISTVELSEAELGNVVADEAAGLGVRRFGADPSRSGFFGIGLGVVGAFAARPCLVDHKRVLSAQAGRICLREEACCE